MADSINASNLPAATMPRRHLTLDPSRIIGQIVAALPDGWDLYAGYVDGRYPSYQPAVARFGAEKCIPIAVFSTTNAGLVGDCENGDMTPTTAVSWVVMRRRSGVDPTIYCSLALWPTVKAAFAAANVAEPHWWIAAYPGNGAQLYDGSIAHQYSDAGPYDESVVADFWPGFDPITPPAPNSPPVHYPGDNVQSQNVSVQMSGGNGWIPSPVNAAKFIGGWFAVENPDKVGHYDTVPTVVQASATPGPNTPNGAIVARGLVPDGQYTLVLWFAGYP